MAPTKLFFFLAFFLTNISFAQYNTKLLYIEKMQKSNEFILAINELENIPKAQFAIAIQAVVGADVVAREDISALRKDVTAKLYG